MFQIREFSNDLSKSIAERNWFNIKNHITEASLQNSDSGYALHIICSDPSAPIEIVKEIYFAFPQAALTKDNQQHTPLCIAVDYGFEDAVEFLVNTCPEDIEDCASYLRSAVHSLICTKIIDSLTTANPEVAFITDNDGDSAFDLFFRIWNVSMRIVIQNSIASDRVLDDDTGQGNWSVGDIYQKACLLLWAANFRNDSTVRGDTCLLHSAMREESCPWAFGMLLIKLHPEQVLERDANRSLPIHIIASTKNMSDESSLFCIDCCTTKSKIVHMEYLDRGTNYCCEDCFERESKQSMRKIVYIEPGKLYFQKFFLTKNSFSFIKLHKFSPKST